MKREIIKIDTEKCNGCGLCVPDCPEGALQIIDGKAQLVGDLFCDGLGACISTCPEDAIIIEEREAEPYNERTVMENIIKQGPNVVKAHLKHLDEHGEQGFLNEALELLKEKNIAVPDYKDKPEAGCHGGHDHQGHQGGCPGSMAMDLRDKPKAQSSGGGNVSVDSELRQWPIQLKLLNPSAPYFDNADLLLAADCVPFSYGNFHQRFLKDKIVIMFCPKLDPYMDEYVDKLTEILLNHEIKSITVARMEVPCCGGISMALQEALNRSGKNIFVKESTISIKGEII
ncbi:MAG: 4Fe-4S dicluster domain-containing protein [bacterium]|nr:4Fe-4S dicluster domain-containing protein [bacterium]